MSNHVYRLSEIVGSSTTSIDDAIRTAIQKAAGTVRNIEWFETKEIRGHVADGDVAHFQVTLKVGFRVEDCPRPSIHRPATPRVAGLGGLRAAMAALRTSATGRRCRPAGPVAHPAGATGRWTTWHVCDQGTAGSAHRCSSRSAPSVRLLRTPRSRRICPPMP